MQFNMMLLGVLLLLGAAAGSSQIPPIKMLGIDLTGCWEMGASNGKPPVNGCGTAPLDKGDGLVYIAQQTDGTVDACLAQACYRPATGLLTNTSSGAGMLHLRTLTDKGNCTRSFRPSFPTDGLLESLNFILPVGWPTAGNATWGTHVPASDLSGVYINNDNPAGDAGGIFLSRHVDQAACKHVRQLPDCTGVAPTPRLPPLATATESPTCAAALNSACGSRRRGGQACMHCLENPTHHAAIKRAGCTPPDVQEFCNGAGPPPPPDVKPHNTTGCYVFGGSAGMGCPGGKGHVPCDVCGMQAATSGHGHAYVSHSADGSIKVCLRQFCSRVLFGTFHTASNGVGFMTTETEFNVGNCTSHTAGNFPAQGLFAHIDFVVPAGWPNTTLKSRGTNTTGAHTLTGMFVNNGPQLAGTLVMDPDVDPSACDSMRELPYCATFVPPQSANGTSTL